ncbi:AraC family transcriptional regulator [Chryseobacterium koreense]|uniref:helix-turn-helix domain-containing protein n=1 Tax=Chryseobacterium koreense TaxID=232216 RepID=UPI0026EC980D|nr:AraC family transcriptional regulator [Chryseobacterium koreense]
MKIFIKNMVCNRCIEAVKDVFEDSETEIKSILLGEVETENELSKQSLEQISDKLKHKGFEILEDSTQKLLEKIKKTIIQKIAELDIAEDFLLSEFLANELHKDYSALSKLFSQNHEMTLEQFFILQKIEKVKELLFYNEFSLTEIAGKLGYKSIQHLSSQFKGVTGFTPTEFKRKKEKDRQPLDLL